jgi:hypothetical protein
VAVADRNRLHEMGSTREACAGSRGRVWLFLGRAVWCRRGARASERLGMGPRQGPRAWWWMHTAGRGQARVGASYRCCSSRLPRSRSDRGPLARETVAVQASRGQQKPAGTRSGGADGRPAARAGGRRQGQSSRDKHKRALCPLARCGRQAKRDFPPFARLVAWCTRHPSAPQSTQSTPTSLSNPTRPPSIECLRVWHAVAPCYRSQFSALVTFVK